MCHICFTAGLRVSPKNMQPAASCRQCHVTTDEGQWMTKTNYAPTDELLCLTLHLQGEPTRQTRYGQDRTRVV